MQRLALACAAGALVAVALASPGQYVALGLAIAAIGTGRIAFSRRQSPGPVRLAGAAAMAIGVVGVLLAAVRVVIALVAISHLDQLI